jgi:hypothetical protein
MNMQPTGTNPENADRIAAAFRAADYIVGTGDAACRVRIGRRHPALDERVGHRPWSIVTAFNPGARRRDDDANRASDAALRRQLDALAPAVLIRCTNRDPAGDWPDEPSWLFAPADADAADALAAAHGQAAIVFGRPGEPASLRFVDRRPRAAASSEQGNA